MNADRGTSGAEYEKVRDEEVRQVRLRQQELAKERAIEAAKERKKKQDEEKERRNMVAKAKQSSNGDKLGKATSSGTGGFSPLQPWSSSTGG